MKFVPNSITAKVARQALKLQKHSPAIMFGAGLTTAVAATVFACKATLNLEEVLGKHEDARKTAGFLLEQKREEYSPQMYTQDLAYIRVRVIRDVAKLYAPALGLGVVSIGLLTGAHVTLTKRNLALASAYGVLDKGFREYRARVREELGEEKDREFLYGAEQREVIEETEHGHVVKTVKRQAAHGKSIYARHFDEYNKHWSPSPDYNRVFLMSSQNYLNDRLNAYGHVFLNEAYDLLGLERSTAGQVVGWVKNNRDGDGYIDFGIFENGNSTLIDDFMRGEEGAILLDFNVDGVVHHLLETNV